jgi:Na+-translocating ferredoxin:NAD+ oxidoreductase RnfC subunit
LHLNNRKAPTARLMQKLGLTPFRNVGPLRHELLSTTRVGIRLKQHIGAPCEPTVTKGQSVATGQVVGQPPVQNGKPALGAPVHASIDGRVTGIENGVVWIEKT